ncbi:fungal-specific transcription factor domain-containing protein [Sporodiniella umbellata]|nr:fungal-specific transcription factor domain-containing protein [Sporodiniella umbellata]
METSEHTLNNPNDPRKKATKACTSCREKKVKCDGGVPCQRCLKHEMMCVYQHKIVKTGGESDSIRLKRMGKALEQLSRLLDFQQQQQQQQQQPLPSQPDAIEECMTLVDTIGKANYLPDSCLRTDRVPKRAVKDPRVLLRAIEPPQEIYNTEPIQAHLLVFYFDYIDPLLPILHQASFYQQLDKVSSLLLNAIYCVASRWDMKMPAGDEPRGWRYYQRALVLLEDQKASQLSTVQAVLLLLKYNEHVRRPGFLWRTRYYFQMAVRMCKDIGLEHNVPVANVSPDEAVELEKRKRTFWAVYCYDVMMSIEYRTPFHLGLYRASEPKILYGENPKKIVHFLLLTKVIHCQAQIADFLRKKFDPGSSVVNFLTGWDEEETVARLAGELKQSMTTVFSLIPAPQQDNMSYAVCFLSLACYYAIISLYRPFTFHLAASQHCLEAAYHMKRIIGIILKSEATEDMYCSLRGIPQIVHYLSAAITVFKEGGRQDELNTLLPIVYHLASISPVTEMPIIVHRTQNRSTTVDDEMQHLVHPSIPPLPSYLDLLNN